MNWILVDEVDFQFSEDNWTGFGSSDVEDFSPFG